MLFRSFIRLHCLLCLIRKNLCREPSKLQHSSDRILRRMGRRTSRKDLINIIAKLRKAMPDIILRTTLITGFPGENEEDVEDLISFVKKMRFERLGVFCYSLEVCSTEPSCILTPFPIRIEFTSPRNIAPNQILHPSPITTSPIMVALSAR